GAGGVVRIVGVVLEFAGGLAVVEEEPVAVVLDVEGLRVHVGHRGCGGPGRRGVRRGACRRRPRLFRRFGGIRDRRHALVGAADRRTQDQWCGGERDKSTVTEFHKGSITNIGSTFCGKAHNGIVGIVKSGSSPLVTSKRFPAVTRIWWGWGPGASAGAVSAPGRFGWPGRPVRPFDSAGPFGSVGADCARPV